MTAPFPFWVWITGYPGSATRIAQARDHRHAIALAAATWRAHHHGEILEVASVEENPFKSTRRRFVRMTSRGVEFL